MKQDQWLNKTRRKESSIISSDERSSSILYLLTASKCIRQLVKKELPGAPGGIFASVRYTATVLVNSVTSFVCLQTDQKIDICVANMPPGAPGNSFCYVSNTFGCGEQI